MERNAFIRNMFYFMELCAKRKTGTRKEIAKRLNMSESGVKRMITDLRDSGIDIEFDHSIKSYVGHQMVKDTES